MGDTIIKLFIYLILIFGVIMALSAIGMGIGVLIPYSLLVEAFAFLRYLLYLPDTFIHIPTLLSLLGLSMLLYVSFYSIKAIIFVYKFLRRI